MKRGIFFPRTRVSSRFRTDRDSVYTASIVNGSNCNFAAIEGRKKIAEGKYALFSPACRLPPCNVFFHKYNSRVQQIQCNRNVSTVAKSNCTCFIFNRILLSLYKFILKRYFNVGVDIALNMKYFTKH